MNKKHFAKKSLGVLAIVGFFGFFSLLDIVYGYGWYRYQNARKQPIAFSHRLHVGQKNFKCTTCHLYVDKSRHAGLPYVKTCMNCHQNIDKISPDLTVLREHYKEKKTIEWSRIYRLPDFIYFSHKRHVNAGKKYVKSGKRQVETGLDCSECHGKVEWMETMHQVASLKMGWCISCHKAKNAPRDCWTCHK